MAKELGNLALFLAHVAPFYPDDLADLPDQIGGLLRHQSAQAAAGAQVAPLAGAYTAGEPSVK